MTDKTKPEKRTTTDCPCCLIASEDCACGLSALVHLRTHEAGDLCCVKIDDNLFSFILIIDEDGVSEMHNYIQSNLATTIIFNCSTFGIRDSFEAQIELARKHAHFVLKKAKAKT